MDLIEWALFSIVLNGPLLAGLLLYGALFERVQYVDPLNTSNPIQPNETQSPPVSGAGPPGAGTGGETG